MSLTYNFFNGSVQKLGGKYIQEMQFLVAVKELANAEGRL